MNDQKKNMTMADKWEIDSKNLKMYAYNKKGELVPAKELFPNDNTEDISKYKDDVTYTF